MVAVDEPQSMGSVAREDVPLGRQRERPFIRRHRRRRGRSGPGSSRRRPAAGCARVARRCRDRSATDRCRRPSVVRGHVDAVEDVREEDAVAHLDLARRRNSAGPSWCCARRRARSTVRERGRPGRLEDAHARRRRCRSRPPSPDRWPGRHRNAGDVQDRRARHVDAVLRVVGEAWCACPVATTMFTVPPATLRPSRRLLARPRVRDGDALADVQRAVGDRDAVAAACSGR